MKRFLILAYLILAFPGCGDNDGQDATVTLDFVSCTTSPAPSATITFQDKYIIPSTGTPTENLSPPGSCPYQKSYTSVPSGTRFNVLFNGGPQYVFKVLVDDIEIASLDPNESVSVELP